MSQQIRSDRFHRKPWRASWTIPELEHRKFSKANMGDGDYDEEVNLYFGDLHKHSSLSPCADVGHWNGGLQEIYDYCRYQRGDDFIAICDHGERIDAGQWRRCMEVARANYEPGKFLAWPSVEWASPGRGHRNIYYKSHNAPFLTGLDYPTPRKLWAAIRAQEIDALTIPHHAARELGCDLTQRDDELDVAYEMFSGWGNEEFYGAPMQDTDHCFTRNFAIDTLLRGFRYGFVGGGDGHPALAGESGLTGIYARDLTLESMWEALRARRTIATTGAKIRLDFHINGFPMGSSLDFGPADVDELFPLEIGVAVQGTFPIAKVEIIENGACIYTKEKPRARLDQMAFRWFRTASPTNGAHLIGDPLYNVSRFIYIRVTQRDGHMAWSSPIWLNFSYGDDE